MMKYLKLFSNHAAYEAAESGLVLPNVSLCAQENEVHYLPVEPITIVYKGDNASATNIMTKTINAFGDTYTLDEASITKMTLDDNKVTLTDFNIANLGQYGETCDVYTYTFNDANEHTLKVWTNSSDMFRLSPRFGGPSPSQSAYFSSIKSVVIPNTITTIGAYAFGGCSGLTNVTIPDSVTSIGQSAFQNCEGLTSVTIGSSVTSIGREAFRGCSGLTSITIPSSVTSISEFTFMDCTSLKRLNSDIDGVFNIPSNVTSIGNNAFRYCSGLTSITIPDSVTSIGEGAFGSCKGLTSIVVDSANTVYDSRNNCNALINSSTNELIKGCKNTIIPNTVTSIGSSAFNSCDSLTSITIPDSVTSIGREAFRDCTGLTSVTIGSGVTSIGDYAFYGCRSLTSITIPDSVTSIGNAAFQNCTGLTSVTSNATTAPPISDFTFYNVKTGGTLRVPSGSSGYDVWMGTGNYYLGKYNWRKVEQ